MPGKTKQVYKPNFVFACLRQRAIIHLGCLSPNSSSDLPENAARIASDFLSGQLIKTFPYLVLHREEFA